MFIIEITRATYRSAILLVLLSMLTACGYTLRGNVSGDLPVELQTLQLQSTAGNSSIFQTANRALNSSGINIIDESLDGIYQLQLGTEQVSERVVSVNSAARAGEYELTMTVPFQLSSDTGFVIEPEILSTQRVYLADPNNAVAKSDEAELIRNEMRQALVTQIIRRLQNLSF